MPDNLQPLFVYGTLGVGLIFWILAVRSWADLKASAWDAYWGIGGFVLAGIVAPFLASKYPDVPGSDMILMFFSFGGAIYTAMIASVAIACFMLAWYFNDSHKLVVHTKVKHGGHGHHDEHHAIPASDEGAEVDDATGLLEETHEHHSQPIAATIFFVLGLAAFFWTLASGNELLAAAKKQNPPKPVVVNHWDSLYAAAKQFDKEVVEMFKPEKSPVIAVYIPAERLNTNDQQAVLKDVRDSIATLKLNITVGPLVGIIVENRSPAMDRIVIYQEVDPKLNPNDINWVKSTRSVYFRDKMDLVWIGKLAEQIDKARKQNTMPASSQPFAQLGYPSTTSQPSIGQHAVIK